jgi:hypothetical protein
VAGEEEQVPGEGDIPSEEKAVQGVVASLEDLASFETQTLAAEVNVLGLLRDRMCSAARYGGPIQSGYRRVHYRTEMEAEESAYLSEGFPFSESAKLLSGLLVVDNYSTVEPEPSTEASRPRIGQYTGERLYLSTDKKWILAERKGQYSEAEDSSSEWAAHCKPIPDRQVLDRYSVEMVTAGLFAATNKVWERLSPRMEALKKRHEKVVEVSGMLAKFTGLPPEEGVPTPPERKTNEDKPSKRSLTRR